VKRKNAVGKPWIRIRIPLWELQFPGPRTTNNPLSLSFALYLYLYLSLSSSVTHVCCFVISNCRWSICPESLRKMWIQSRKTNQTPAELQSPRKSDPSNSLLALAACFLFSVFWPSSVQFSLVVCFSGESVFSGLSVIS